MSDRVQLTDDEAAQLAQAEHAVRRVRQDAEIALHRAKAAVLEAEREAARLLDQLAAAYHFDAAAIWTFDRAAKTLTPTPTNGNGAPTP